MTFLVCSHFLKQVVNTLEKVSHEINNCAIRFKKHLKLSQLESSIVHISCHTVVCSPGSCAGVGLTISAPLFLRFWSHISRT